MAPASTRTLDCEHRVAAAFRRAGWKVQTQPTVGDLRTNLMVRSDDYSYVVEIKATSEGRKDRLIPLLSMAILQAQVLAKRSRDRVLALAVVGARRVTESLVSDLERFAREYAPGVSVGVIDLEGFQWFRGPGLDNLGAKRERTAQRLRARTPEIASQLFSDLNQWMLKILLAPQIPLNLMAGPRAEYRNASQLAAAASVSVMTAFRFIRQLRREHFLDESAPPFRLVRLDELFRRWRASNLRSTGEIGMKWVLRGNSARQVHDALRLYERDQTDATGKRGRARQGPVRVCLGLFAAADELGFGFVGGVSPHIYIERLTPSVLQRLGLSLEVPDSSPDIYVRVPATPESVFRGAVCRKEVPVCDVFQIWLDASAYPARGLEQAELVYDRVLRPLLGKG